MAQKGLTIYTAPSEPPHFTADDDAALNRARYGNGSGITEADEQLACSKIDNNTVQLAPGVFMAQGYAALVAAGTTEKFTVDSGTIGAFRRDFVIAEYIRGGGDVNDRYVFRILKGTPASTVGAVADPVIVQDDLPKGGTTRQEPLYRITINGTTIESITQLADNIGNYYE